MTLNPPPSGGQPFGNRQSAIGNVLVVFTKAPILGFVKSRLAARLGSEKALEAHRELLTALVRNLAPLDSLTLCVTPDDSAEAFNPWRRSHWPVWPQGEGDLGARLARAFLRAFQEGAKRVVVIGADCPDAGAEHIRGAWRALGEAELVVGPACDGGYWLLGLSRWTPELFENMPWSGPTLFDRTTEVASNQKLRVKLLEKLADIDTDQDWQAYQERRRSASTTTP